MNREKVRALILALTNPHLLLNRRKQGARQEIRRIVVVRPDHLGDLLFATPVLEMLRDAYPHAHITGLVGPWGKAMWQGNHNLDALKTVEFPGIVANKGGTMLAPYNLLRSTASELRKEKYDLGIVLRFDHWWGAALLAASGVPRRWGYNTPGMKTWLTKAVPYSVGRHEVEQNVALAAYAIANCSGGRNGAAGTPVTSRSQGLPRLHPPRAEQPGNTEVLEMWLKAPRRAVIHPGTASANKLWTVEGWAIVTRSLLASGWAVVITGAPDEQRLADAIVAAVAPLPEGITMVNLAGRTTSLAQLVWVLAHAGMVLGVDSGPLHIADALGSRSLHLYGPSDEAVWGPWGNPERHRAFRAPGTRPTMQLDVGSTEIEGGPEMKAISPEMVLREVDKLG